MWYIAILANALGLSWMDVVLMMMGGVLPPIPLMPPGGS